MKQSAISRLLSRLDRLFWGVSNERFARLDLNRYKFTRLLFLVGRPIFVLINFFALGCDVLW